MWPFRSTRTFVEMEVSAAAYDEIAGKLRDAGYDHAFVGGAIDMEGIGLTRGSGGPVHNPAHRPIAPNAKTTKREPKR